MRSRYKVYISNKNIYKEIELDAEMTTVKVGTSAECDVRLRRELFFEPVELVFENNNGEWILSCSDNLCISVGDVRKLVTKTMAHGDELNIKYQESNNDLFSLLFMIDFDYGNKDYERMIQLGNIDKVVIGGVANALIVLQDEYLGNDSFVLQRENGVWVVVDNATRYGVYVNGKRIDKRAQVHDKDFISIVGFSFYLNRNCLYTSKTVKVNGLQCVDIKETKSCLKYPKFNRNSRIQYVIPEEKIEVQQATQMPVKPRKNIVMTLIPAIAMLLLTIVIRGFIGGGGTFVIYSVCTMSIGVIMSVVTYFEDKKHYKEDCEKRIETYNQYIAEKRIKIEESRRNELRIRRLIYESLENSIKEIDVFGGRLFEKSPQDKDYLQVYLGKGRVESANPVEYVKQEFIDLEDPLATIPENISKEYQYIEDAPITADFNESNGVGIVGERKALMHILRNMTLDLALRHFYKEVKFVYILKDMEVDSLNWLRWLRNLENEQLDAKNIVCDEESRTVLLESLYAELSYRESVIAMEKDTGFDSNYVVFVTDSSAISCHPISKYIKEASNYGFTFVFFEENKEWIPQGCDELIRVDSNASGNLIKTLDGEKIHNFVYPVISNDIAEAIAKKLAAIWVDEVTLEGQLTKNITLFQLLNIMSVEDLDLNMRWKRSQVYKSLSAPLGVKTKNQVVELDISDKGKAHGPHGLVAGTTGSGKSEILQTYILSMATLYHPYEVGFVIIDFKGGGMANQFKKLPHLIGTITNIDGREINRSLSSIKAELIKRQEYFSQCGVNHINDYIKLYKEQKVDKPLPHLIMIVDEFAELKMEYPDFMKEIISAARIGRTLGIHLILATQKPAGVVDNQIWSNSKFKLCLKVQTKEDSMEVIKTPLASEIVEPGRAYFQVGNNEIFELFQSAYSGSDVPTGSEMNERSFKIVERNIWGKRKVVYTNKKTDVVQESVTQLEAIVDYVNQYCEEAGIIQLPGICLPPMPDVIRTSELRYEKQQDSIAIPIGIFDDPEQQRQEQLYVEPSKENMYIVGSSQMGKTVLLQTMIYGLMRTYTSKQVNMYLVDCGSRMLKMFEKSNFVGGVVLSNEEEKCKNLFKLLNTIVTERKNILSDKGISNYASYIEAGYEDLPMIVVMIDNMAAFKEYFPNQAEELNGLCREAQGVGISFIVTAAATNALSYRTQANFGRKLILNCNDTNEYSNMLGRCREVPKEVPGRGFAVVEKRVLEFQSAIFGKSEKEAERSREMMEFIEERNATSTTKAKAIPMVPERLVLEELMAETPEAFRQKRRIPIGINYGNVAVTYVDMNDTSSLAIIGDDESGVKFIGNYLRLLSKTIVFHEVQAVVIDDKAKRLEYCKEYGFVEKYISDVRDAVTEIVDICKEVADRNEEDGYDASTDTLKIVAIASQDVIRKINADKNDCKILADTIRDAQDLGVFFLLGGVENQAVSFNAPDVMKIIKEQRKGILFAPLAENKVYDISLRRNEGTAYGNSTGYIINGNEIDRIKVYE